MPKILTGDMTAEQLDDEPRLRVRSPRLPLRLDVVEDAPGDSRWDEAIAANDLTPAIRPVVATPVLAAPKAEPMAMLAVAGSPDAQTQLQMTPEPGEGLLLMVQNGDVVQWYLPQNAATPAIGKHFKAVADALAEPAPLTFHVPQSLLATRPGVAPHGAMAKASALSFGPVLRFFRFPLIGDLLDGVVEKTVAFIAKEIEERSKKESFVRFDPEHKFPPMSPADLANLNGRVLLLTHGIFSSTTGAFRDFGTAGDDLLADLRATYGPNNIIGWDHHTVSKTPLDNARDLLTHLPANLEADILCHSRGALITRAMLEHPDLQQLMQQKIPNVGKLIFVAGANQGSQLAKFENLNRLLNIYSAVASIPILGGAGVVLHVIVGLLKVLAHGAVKLPSIVALQPDEATNPFLKDLNDGALATPVDRCVVVHANYDPRKGVLKQLLDFNVDIIFNTANDMVVPFAGAELFDKLQVVSEVNNIRFGSPAATQGDVMHTNFFSQKDVRDIIRQTL